MPNSFFRSISFVLLCWVLLLGLGGCVSGSGDTTFKSEKGSISIALTDPVTGKTVTSITASNAAKVTATVRDPSGNLVPNVVVTFSSAGTLATLVPASGTALTDATGTASIQIIGASPTAAGASTISATATLSGATTALSVSAGFSVLSSSTGTTGISIVLTNPVTGTVVSSINASNAAKVTATVRDTSGAPVPNTVVTFATAGTLATMIPASGSALTDASGVAAIQIIGASPTAAGATTVSATATVGGASLSVSTGFGVNATSTGATGISMALTNPLTGTAVSNISTGNPARVTATVRDAAGAVVPNTVVTFATTPTLAAMTPSTGTALTDASGVATIQISAVNPTASGATTISASASVGGASLSASVGFSVTATSSGVAGYIQINPITQTINRIPTIVDSIQTLDLLDVSAKVTDAVGNPLQSAVVTFTTPGGLLTMFPASGSAVTNSSGTATIQIATAGPTAAGAASIIATAIVNGTPISNSVNLTVIAKQSAATVSVVLTNRATGGPVTNISSDKPGRVTATVKNGNGTAIPNAVVTFATSPALANITPSLGTALTDASGVAIVQIDPISPLAAGATTVTAAVTVDGLLVTGSASYSVTPTSVGVAGASLALVDPNSGSAVSSVSPGSPAKVLATIRDASGAGVPNTVVTFSTNPALASMTPPTGTALTNASGVASIQIDAASLTAAGATTITATASVAGSAVTAITGFSVSAANAALGSFTLGTGTGSLSPYATTSVSIPVTGVPGNTPVTINFSSICSGSGKASLPASVQTVNGVATATYTDKGCAQQDTITASVAGLAVTKTITLKVDPPGPASIQFVSATPSTIVLKGTGGAGLLESSLVKFRVVDSNNQPIVTGVNVTFDLTTRTGGILLDGLGTAVTKLTDANGEASVTVQSGTTPTAVWVNASLSATPLLSQSNQLRISTGRPAQDRFTMSLSTFNIEGYSTNGVTTDVSVIASDRLGNPVPDGTAINFISEGGQIAPSCATTNGACSVTFTSANPRPILDTEPSATVTKGRVTVVAYSVGEESFIDANANNKYDSGEAFNDLGEVFINNNESVDADGNPVWDSGEQSIAFGSSNTSTCVTGIVTSPRAPSKAGTCDGKWGSAHVRQNAVIILSGSTGYVKADAPATGSDVPGSIAVPSYSVGGAGICNRVFGFYAFDQNKNPLPFGTTLATVSPPTSLGTVTISPSSVGNSTAPGGTAHTIQIAKPTTTDPDGNVTCKTVGSGGVTLNVAITTPKGAATTVAFTITD